MIASWTIESLGDICEFKYGKSLKSDDRVPGAVEVMGSNGRVGWHDQSITAGPTVVVGRKGSIGQIAYSRNACWPIDTTYYIDSSSTKHDLRWLYWTLQSVGLTGMNKSAAVPGLNREDAYRVRIPLPSLPEQRRIADILDRADALRAQRRRALLDIESLEASLFLAMFEFDRPSDWRIAKLSEIAQFFGGNSLPRGELFSGQKDGAFLLKVSDLNRPGNEREVASAQLWSSIDGSKASTAPERSIVIPKRGGAIGTNKKRILTRTSVLDPNLMGIAAKKNLVLPEYLFAWFQKLDLNTLVSGSSVPQLNKQDLAPLPIAVPPLESQLEFSVRIGEVKDLRLHTTASMSAFDELFASLQHRAFQGEL